MFSRKKTHTQIGAITFENVMSIFTQGADGKPLAIVQHSIDQQTLLTLGAIALGTALIIKLV